MGEPITVYDSDGQPRVFTSRAAMVEALATGAFTLEPPKPAPKPEPKPEPEPKPARKVKP